MWADFLETQEAALAAVEAKAESAAGPGDRAPRGMSVPYWASQHAGAPAGADRPAKPKGDPMGEAPWPPCDEAGASGQVVIDPYLAMDEDAEDPAGTFPVLPILVSRNVD